MTSDSDGRRSFFTQFGRRALKQGNILHNELKGIRMMGLETLNEAPDEVIRQMIPEVRPGLSLRIDNELVLHAAFPEKEEKAIRKLDMYEHFIYQQINGQITVQTISERLARIQQLSPDIAFRKTRTFFVELCQEMVIQPSAADA